MPDPSYRLIIFDLDDTVWPCAPVIQAAETALQDWLAQRVPRLVERYDPLGLREHRRDLMAREPAIAHDVGQVRRRSLELLLAELDYPTDLAGEAMALFMDHRNRVEPYPDVEPALRDLARRYRLASVTNGNANVELTPLQGLFEHSICAADAGAAKPDPAIFEHLLALTGCERGQCIYVGDDPWLDVAASRAFGLTPMWMNRGAREWPAELDPPALALTDLHGLTAWLAGH